MKLLANSRNGRSDVAGEPCLRVGFPQLGNNGVDLERLTLTEPAIFCALPTECIPAHVQGSIESLDYTLQARNT